MSLSAGVLVSLLAVLFAAQAPAPVALTPSVDLAVPYQPVTFRQGDRDHLVYELHVTNFQRVDVLLHAIRITDVRGPIVEYRDGELHRLISRPGLRNDHAAPHVLAPGMRAVINFWVPLGQGSTAPPAVAHELALTVQRPDQPETVRVSGGSAAVSSTAAVELDAPLGNGNWVAIYDPLLVGGHRTAIYTLEGRARIPGRFAIDFIELPPAGALDRNRDARPATGNGFGTDVLAVADGTIATAVDGVADHAPQPVPADIAAGNHISIDLGNGRFVFYEHLQRGSVRVKAGQRVTRGEVIARLGASGSTSIGPHLHFHVADANATLAAEGMPFVFRQFTTLGEFASITALTSGERWVPGELARTAFRARPTPNAVISFR